MYGMHICIGGRMWSQFSVGQNRCNIYTSCQYCMLLRRKLVNIQFIPRFSITGISMQFTGNGILWNHPLRFSSWTLPDSALCLVPLGVAPRWTQRKDRMDCLHEIFQGNINVRSTVKVSSHSCSPGAGGLARIMGRFCHLSVLGVQCDKKRFSVAFHMWVKAVHFHS